MNEKDSKLRLKYVEQVLFNDWDPIGVNDGFEAIDEYDSYAPQIVSMSLKDDFSETALVEYLHDIRTNKMGLPANKDLDRKVSIKLVEALKV